MRKYFIFILIFLLFTSIPGSYATNVKPKKLPKGVVFWSNNTKQFFETKNKLKIDKHAYVISYDLKKGWIKVHTNFPEIIAFCDPFSGHWIKKYITGTENITLPFTVMSYNGLRILVISSPLGFGIVKEVEEPLSFWDYPIVILRSELAKFGWQRAFYSVCLFIVGLALARYLKRDKMVVQFEKHIVVVFVVCLAILAVLGVAYKTDVVRLNQTVKHVPHIVFSTYQIKDMYNYCFVAFFIIGYILGYLLWGYDILHIAFVSYSKLKLFSYPYNGLAIRDWDGKLTLIEFENDFKQLMNFELNGYSIGGILAVGEENFSAGEKPSVKIGYALAGFFGFFVLTILGDHFNVFRIDLVYSFLLGSVIAVLTNMQAVKHWMGFNIEKIKILKCSELMNEDNYTKMLKEAEIKHVTEDYERLLRDYVKEKITTPRKTVKHLLSMIRQVRAEKAKEKSVGKSE